MGAAGFNVYRRCLDSLNIAAGSLGTVPVVVRKDLWDSGTMRSVQDLKGRTIALNGTGNILEYSLYRVLQHGDLTPPDVQLVFMPFPNMVPALQNQPTDPAMLLN